MKLFYDWMCQWHLWFVFLPTRVGTHNDGSPHRVWMRVIETRTIPHPGYGDVECRLVGSEDSWVQKGEGSIELPMNY